MTDNDPFGTGVGGQDKRPWFGQKRLGFGFGPRTWQGYLVTAILAGFVIVVGTVTKTHSPLFPVAIAAVVLVPLIITAIQRR